MLSSIALGCNGYEAHMQQIRAENAKPSQFSRVFLEVPDGLRRDNLVQALIAGASQDVSIQYITSYRAS